MYADYHERHGHGGHYGHHHGGCHHEHGYHHDYASGEGQPDANSELVCPCVGVAKADIEQAVANGARTLEDVENATGVGTRCGRCTGAVEAVLQEALRPKRRRVTTREEHAPAHRPCLPPLWHQRRVALLGTRSHR